MRNIIVRSIRGFHYTVKAANIETSTVDTITVSVPTNLKRPERQLQKYMPEHYTFMAMVGDPVPNCAKFYMETKDFMQYAKPYEPKSDDVVEE